MENNSILTKFSSLSVEESPVDQHQKEEMEARPQKGWLCNELVHELCKRICVLNTSERILLTSLNMHTYLMLRFRKMRLIYRDAIAFLKALLNAKERAQIRIDRVVQQNNDPIVVINQEQSEDVFKLESNEFRIQIWNANLFKNVMTISDNVGRFENESESAHLVYFLRLTAPLLQPIRLNLELSNPSAGLVRFLDTRSDWIDSIGLFDHQFVSEPIYRTLSKCNKLQLYEHIRPVHVPFLIRWLNTSNNNNSHPKKCLILEQGRIGDGLELLIGELKKEFARATSKSRFVVCLKLCEWADEFTLYNELTGEKLELRFKNIKKEYEYYTIYIYTLSRFPNNELDDNGNDFAELDFGLIYLHY